LREYGKTHPEEIKEIYEVRFCTSMDFLIGKGGDGTRVYVGLGRDGCERAVKRLPRDACFPLAEQEKKVLNLPSVKMSNYVIKYWWLDDYSDKEYLFLIMDLCEETLENVVHRSSLDDPEKTAHIIRQILKGLADLHRDPIPILHRDLKPSNILRDVYGNWLLADFGISRFLKEGVSTHQSNQRGTEDWRAVESSCPSNVIIDDGNVRYKKESDIQVGFFERTSSPIMPIDISYEISI
jgi:serine/threonine protein kinase